MTLYPPRTAVPRPDQPALLGETPDRGYHAERIRSASLSARDHDRGSWWFDGWQAMRPVPRAPKTWPTSRATPRAPRKALLCRFGFHAEYTGTTARQGYVRFLYCRRESCGWSAIRKGAA